MQVYKIEPTTAYTYGCALIAAKTEDEAIDLFRTSNEYRDFEYDEYNCSCEFIEGLDFKTDIATIILDKIGYE